MKSFPRKLFLFLFLILSILSLKSQSQWTTMGVKQNRVFNLTTYAYSDIDGEGKTIAISDTFTVASQPFPIEIVKIKDWDGTSWVQRGSNIIPNVLDGLALSGNGNVVSIYSRINPYPYPNTNSGVIFIYEWSGSSWVQLGDSIIPNPNHGSNYPFDEIGKSMDLSNDGYSIVIGADNSARVYVWNGNSWLQRGQDLVGDQYDDFGYSVSMSGDGNTIAISSPQTDPVGNLSTHYGKTRIYEWQNGWNLKGNIIRGENIADFSGGDIQLSNDGNSIIIGSPGNSDAGRSAGHARVFKWSGSSWFQVGNDIDGEAPEDKSGRAVSINSDGTIVAIGAPFNSDGGNNAGHVRVYKWNGIVWFQEGMDIDGNPPRPAVSALGPFFGSHLTLNHAGNIFITVSEADYSKVYSYCSDSTSSISQTSYNQIQVDLSNADSYQWYDCSSGNPISGASNQALNVTDTGSYKAEIFINGCILSSDCFKVDCYNPNLSLSQPDSNSIQVNFSNADSYQWYDCNSGNPISGGNSPVLNVLDTGSYKVEINLMGCTLISNCIAVKFVGIHELSQLISKLYPNPNRGIVNIDFNGEVNGNLSIFSLDGKTILNKELNNKNRVRLDLTGVSEGTYLIELSDDNGNFNNRIITVIDN